MAPGLPQKTLPDGTVSKITVVPFYDRTGLIKETIGTLETSLSHEILICIIVIIVLVLNLRASVVIASMLPIAVLSTFIIMRYTGIAANIVALSGRYRRDGGRRRRVCRKHHPVYGDAGEQRRPQRESDGKPYL